MEQNSSDDGNSSIAELELRVETLEDVTTELELRVGTLEDVTAIQETRIMAAEENIRSEEFCVSRQFVLLRFHLNVLFYIQ